MQFIDRIVYIQVVLHFWDARQNVEDRQNAIEPTNMWDGKDDRFPKTDLDGCCIKGCRVPLGWPRDGARGSCASCQFPLLWVLRGGDAECTLSTQW